MKWNTAIARFCSEKSLVTADQLLVSGSSFLSTFLLARAWPVQLFSVYAGVLLMVLLLLSVQQALVLQPWIVLRATMAPEERYSYRWVIVVVQLCFLGLIVLLAVAGWLWRVSWWTPLLSSWWWILAYLVTFLAQDSIRRILLAAKQAASALLVDAFSLLPQLVLLVLMDAHGKLTLSSFFMIGSLTTLPALWWSWDRFGQSVGIDGFSRALFVQHVRQARWLVATAVFQWWAGNAFVVAAGWWLGAGAFAALRLVQNMMGVLHVFFQAFESYVLPRLAERFTASAGSGRAYLKAVSWKAGVAVVPFLLLLVCIAAPLLHVVAGAAYAAYAFLLQGMALLYVFVYLGYPVRLMIRVSLLNRHFFLGYLFTAVFGLLCASPLVRGWQLYGVVAGLMLNQWLLLGYWLFVLHTKKTRR